MSQQKKSRKYTRETFWGRWQIIREVRLPDGYTTPGQSYWRGGEQHVSAPKRVKVAPHITQAVLLDLAQWDFPGSIIYKGVENIAHGTKLPRQSIDKAFAVLREAGILARTRRPGFDQTSVSVLDWDCIETLRQRFGQEYEKTSVADTRVDADANDVPELQVNRPVVDPGSADDVTDLGGWPEEASGGATGELIDLIMSFGPYQGALSRPRLGTVADALLQKHTLQSVSEAFLGLEDWRKCKVVPAKNREGYLRKMIENALDQKPEPILKNSPILEPQAGDDTFDEDALAEELRFLEIEDEQRRW